MPFRDSEARQTVTLPAFYANYLMDNWESPSPDVNPGIATRKPAAAELELLMVRYQNGDFAAANTLIEQVSPMLHRFFMVQSVSRRHADDLLQDTWLRIHAARHTYRAGEPVLPWFFAIARHVRVDDYRKTRRQESREQQVEIVPEPPARSDRNRGPDLDALLSALPESQRDVITMLKVSGMSLEEVARATSASIGSVKQKAHRAYEKLRAALGRSS